MRKMEQSKNLEPYISYSFQELSDVLLQSYKDSTSAGSSAFGQLSHTSGFNNGLREKTKLKPPTSDSQVFSSGGNSNDVMSDSDYSEDSSHL